MLSKILSLLRVNSKTSIGTSAVANSKNQFIVPDNGQLSGLHPWHNRGSKYFKYIKNILFTILILFAVLNVFDLKLIIKIIQHLGWKTIIKYNIVVAFLFIIFQFVEVYLFVLLIKNKLKIPNYLPISMYNWLQEMEETSNSAPETIRAFMEIYVRAIIQHIIALIVMIVVYNHL